ncbi:MAG: hypothetical protein DMF70_12350 [Acidobacteria bacterium]|nr:MAG: hypothetical protein DMF70_12350 [Acidobacteriota bacterium]
MASLKEVADFLNNLRDSHQSVSVSFTGADSEAWQRTGKVKEVGLTTFEVAWDEDNSQSFSYEWMAGIAEGGKLLFLTSASGDRLTVCEERS